VRPPALGVKILRKTSTRATEQLSIYTDDRTTHQGLVGEAAFHENLTSTRAGSILPREVGRYSWGEAPTTTYAGLRGIPVLPKIYIAVDLTTCDPPISSSRRSECWRDTGTVPLPYGGRVPGHELHPVPDHAAPGGPQRLRGGRRRPVDLFLARGQLREHPHVREGFPRLGGDQAGAELPLHLNYPGSGQRRHRPQHQPEGKNLWPERRAANPSRYSTRRTNPARPTSSLRRSSRR
jgi:hypothetical protein